MLQCSAIPRCYSAHLFSRCYSIQPFIGTVKLVIFATVLNSFMILSVILEIISVILRLGRDDSLLSQLGTRNRAARGRVGPRRAGSREQDRDPRGTRVRARSLVGSIGLLDCWVQMMKRRNETHGGTGVRARSLVGSIDLLDHWVQLMNNGTIYIYIYYN
jgi:hypothetical protein